MKKAILLLTITFILPAMQLFAQTSSISWNTNLDYAKKLAVTKNLPLALFFMEEPAGTLSNSVYDNTLSNSLLVDKINNNFVPVIIRGDITLQQEYNVRRTPTLLVLGAKAEEIDRLSGVIGIDQAFAMLENAQLNYAKTYSITTTSTINTISFSDEDIGQVFSYNAGIGSFIKLDSENWVHQTPFYTQNFKQGQGKEEDKRYYYLTTEDRSVNIAVPKTTGSPIWIWQDENNRWVSLELEIVAIEAQKKE